MASDNDVETRRNSTRLVRTEKSAKNWPNIPKHRRRNTILANGVTQFSNHAHQLLRQWICGAQNCLSGARQIQTMVALDLFAPISRHLRLLRVFRPFRYGGANFSDDGLGATTFH